MKFNYEDLITGRTFIIAEMSANHGGDINIAKDTIKAAKESGADAIKIQTYTADTMTIDCENDYFKIQQGTLWDGRFLHELYQEAFTPWEWQKELKEFAESIGLIFFSTPFDKTAVDFLEEIGVELYKVASFEITDIPLIEYIASKGKPMIMSTGIATEDEIEEALQVCKKMGNERVVLLKCTSSYPSPIEDANLLNIKTISEKYGVVSGLSDHTLGVEASIVAVSLGAKIIEKHFIMDKSIGGPDAEFSMIPEHFKNLVSGIRTVETLLGKEEYTLTEKQRKNRKFSRSLFIVKSVKRGELLTDENVRSIRPGDGMKPKFLPEVLGKRFNSDFNKGTPLTTDMFEE